MRGERGRPEDRREEGLVRRKRDIKVDADAEPELDDEQDGCAHAVSAQSVEPRLGRDRLDVVLGRSHGVSRCSRRAGFRLRQGMIAPPVMSRTTPVIQAAASEARKAAALATSWGVPSRLSGWTSAKATCWSLGIRSRLRSVRMVSGAMQLARIPNGPACAATSFVSSTTAALAAP